MALGRGLPVRNRSIISATLVTFVSALYEEVEVEVVAVVVVDDDANVDGRVDTIFAIFNESDSLFLQIMTKR